LLVAQSGNIDELYTCIVNNKLEVESPVTSRVRPGLQDIEFTDGTIDRDGNRYLGYMYRVDKMTRSGVLLQKVGLKDSYLDLKGGQTIQGVENPRFHLSGDGLKIYLYATCFSDNMTCGFALATVDAGLQKIDAAHFFPFPLEVKEWMEKVGYSRETGMNGENYFTDAISELRDGTVVISGYPLVSTFNAGVTRGTFVNYAGPIINGFIKNGEVHFAVIYRNQETSPASGFVAVAADDKLVLLYNDGERNILSADATGSKRTISPLGLVLAQAVFDHDGKLISKSKIANKDRGLNFLTSLTQRLSDNSFLIPVGQKTYNMLRYYVVTEQWANVNLR
jgi:hypothetical protein